MPATRPIVQGPRGTDEIEDAKLASVTRNAVRRGLGQLQGSNPFGDRLAGRRTRANIEIHGGVATAPRN